jgi:hypothetical protein
LRVAFLIIRQLFLELKQAHAMQTYGGVEVQLHELLTATIDGAEWSASHPDSFIPEERTLVPTGQEAA